MNPEQILPHLHRRQSGIPGPQQPVNSYLWKRGDAVVLIDPAGDVMASQLVTEILITHFQAENVAGAVHFPKARVHVPDGDEYLAEGREAYERIIEKWPPPWEWETRGNYRGQIGGARNERPTQHPLRWDVSLTDGAISAGCRVLSTPGHGKHAVTLVATIDGQRVGFCGDLIYGAGQLWNWFDSEWDYGLQGGPRRLLESVARLQAENLDLLCPTHGPVMRDPSRALRLLAERLTAVLRELPPISANPINFVERDSPARGFREILPGLHQWRDGNCNVLVSPTGHALMVDDGLCYWKPLPERAAHHRAVIADVKRALGIRKIEMVIPTHYHGDHTENIPELVALEGTEVVCLDSVAEPIEHPERFNLACPLPWYGTAHDTIPIHRRVRSDERVRWREFELEIFHLGGQTFYHLGVAVVIAGQRVLFVGDAMHNCGSLVPPVLCYNKADPETAGWPYATERMLERQPDWLICGHGSAIREATPLLRNQRDAWQERLREYRALSARSDLRDFFDPFR